MNKLIQASENGDVEIVRLLLETGESKPGHANEYGDTALICASGDGHIEIVRLLLESDESNPEHVNEYGYTALICASRDGHLEIVRLLLETGESKPGHANGDGYTALSRASSNEIRKIILKFLVLEKVRERRKIVFGIVRYLSFLPSIGSPTSNQCFYEMGQSLREELTFKELVSKVSHTTEQNYYFYLQGVKSE